MKCAPISASLLVFAILLFAARTAHIGVMAVQGPAAQGPAAQGPAAQRPTAQGFAHDVSEQSSGIIRVAVDDSAPIALKEMEPLFPGATAPRLQRWRRVEVAASTTAHVRLIFARTPGVVDVSLQPKPELAVLKNTLRRSTLSRNTLRTKRPSEANDDGESCPIKTPLFHPRQGYLKALEVEAAWARPGGRGAEIQLADVEGEWNFRHEDLPTTRLRHVAGARMRVAGWRAHGTAVLGVIAAKENAIGMVGIAPDIKRVVTASMGRIGAARALYQAQRKLNAGDVLIVELHGPGPNADGRGQNGFVPMEWWQPEYDVIRTATERGVIVVEAAGNGAEDLDAAIYRGKFDRKVRDSGAILVGAGAPQSRARLGFSNFGSRVDVQGWGKDVATLDYGDLQGCAATGRKYTRSFAGTSSASPIVAGAAVVIQGVVVGAGKDRLTPVQMRQLLKITGTPQPREATKIGPLPNVRRALEHLQ